MNTDALISKLQQLKEYVATHAVLMFIVLTVVVSGFMVVRIYTLATVEPTQTQIDEKLSTFKPVRLDPTVVALFRSLQSRNISIESLFDNGRTNPFQ